MFEVCRSEDTQCKTASEIALQKNDNNKNNNIGDKNKAYVAKC